MKTRKKGQAGRSRSPEEWIYGLNPVLEAVRSGREVRVVFLSLARRDKVSEIEGEISSRGIKINREDNLFFDSRFAKGHQGIAALVAPRGYADLDELMEAPSRNNEMPLFLLLDGVEDPRNFGAVLRVADAGGVHGVVIQAYRSASLSPEAVKASAGASEHIPIAMVPNIKNAIRDMKESGITIVGAEADADLAPWETDLTGPLSLVMGSEGEGMRKTVREQCDLLVRLPMRGKVNSLNVSVATGIIIFEIMRQRMSKC
ncbi:MAG: 23S rRNA (guanosine(2251)-2'-O)-methyltransferase RlmB [Thermodesulfovibrionales bacterium]